VIRGTFSPPGAWRPAADYRLAQTLFVELGAEVSEREGSRVAVVLFEEVRVFHRPHPSPKAGQIQLAYLARIA
jgi:hypothetical protein